MRDCVQNLAVRFASLTSTILLTGVYFAVQSLSLLPSVRHSGLVSHQLRRLHLEAQAMAQRGDPPDQKEGIQKYVLRFCEATFSPLRAQAGRCLNIIRTPFYRVRAIQVRQRFNNSRRPEDVKYSIEYFRFLRDQPLKPFEALRNRATASLVQALAVQVELGSDDAMHGIEEMTTLCRELLRRLRRLRKPFM